MTSIGRGIVPLEEENKVDIDWLVILLAASVGTTLFELYVDWRQYRYLESAPLPAEVADSIDEKAFMESKAYNRAKLRYSFFTKIFWLSWDIAGFELQLWPLFYTWAKRSLEFIGLICGRGLESGVGLNIIFVIIVNAVHEVVSLPLKWYQNFVLKESHGLNNRTRTLFLADQVKHFVVNSAMSSFIYSLVVKVIEISGPAFPLYATTIVEAFIVVSMVLVPLVTLPLFNRLTPLQEGELRDSLEKLAAEVEYPLKQVYIMDDSKRSSNSNSYLVGLPWNKQIVLSDNILAKCSVQQITAVVNQDLGHWKHYHMSISALAYATTTAIAFATFALVLENHALFRSCGFSELEQPLLARLFIFLRLMSPAGVILEFLLNTLNRRLDFDADRYAVAKGRGEALAEALVILTKTNLTTIVRDKLYASYTQPDPSLPERLENIQKEFGEIERKEK